MYTINEIFSTAYKPGKVYECTCIQYTSSVHFYVQNLYQLRIYKYECTYTA